MSSEISSGDGGRRDAEDGSSALRKLRDLIPILAILLVASILRMFQLGQASLWYDEIVTMRLARTESPAAMLKLLHEIDATRAPAHPILLQGWLAVFGTSDLSGRAFSCLLGILTVALVFWVGLQAFDRVTALWASWLCALSPLLIYYSREVRMYALLVLITCLGWGCLFAHGRSPDLWKLALYGLSLAALCYTHPLGLLMAGSLALASALNHRASGISWRGWLLTHSAVALVLAPWVGQYVGHEPEFVSGRLSLRFLFGMPLGFIGGNFLVLVLCSMLIVYGQCATQKGENGRLRVVLDDPGTCVSLLIWLAVPALVLYAYSRVAHPIFGPARYTLFAAPAYLILVARGLAKLPLPLGIATAAGCAVLSGVLLLSMVYRADLKADWRAAASYLDGRDPSALVAVISADPSRNVEVESARYYFRTGRAVVPCPDRLSEAARGRASVWVSIGLRDGQPMGVLPEEFSNHKIIREVVDFPGLRLLRVDL